jgi:hypothetical protein
LIANCLNSEIIDMMRPPALSPKHRSASIVKLALILSNRSALD